MQRMTQYRFLAYKNRFLGGILNILGFEPLVLKELLYKTAYILQLQSMEHQPVPCGKTSFLDKCRFWRENTDSPKEVKI